MKKSLTILNYEDSVRVWDVNTGKYKGQAHKLCRWKNSCKKLTNKLTGNPIYQRVSVAANKKVHVAAPYRSGKMSGMFRAVNL